MNDNLASNDEAGRQIRRPDFAGFAIAAILSIIALVILWDMSRLQLTSVYGVGPKAMPIVVACGLIILSALNAVLAWRGELPERENADPKAILLIVGGLAGMIALIGYGGGFIPATALLFACTSAAFGRRAFLVDLCIGLTLGVVIFLLFDKLLTLSLPAGPLERLL
ncbi:MAG: tripartite tricarboxylate transporter TctB family protein [Pseudorhodoplanes sp.]